MADLTSIIIDYAVSASALVREGHKLKDVTYADLMAIGEHVERNLHALDISSHLTPRVFGFPASFSWDDLLSFRGEVSVRALERYLHKFF